MRSLETCEVQITRFPVLEFYLVRLVNMMIPDWSPLTYPLSGHQGFLPSQGKNYVFSYPLNLIGQNGYHDDSSLVVTDLPLT